MRCLILLTVAALSAAGQSGYNPAHPWWDSNLDEQFPWDTTYENPFGWLRISNLKGSFRTGGHPFFRPLGVNGRACITCHQPSNAMSLSVENIQKRWRETDGRDPLFAAVDGANCPTLPQGERESHSLLLNRGLFRVALPWPPPGVTPDFRLDVIRDPTNCNKRPGEISVYRRPRMSANLSTLVEGPDGAVLMADGRAATLRAQAIDAALVHQQAKSAPSEEDLRLILDFETQVTATQFADLRGGLTSDFAIQTGGVIGEHRASVERGQALFAARCASCHKAGTTRWQALPRKPLPDLPVFRVTCQSGRVVESQDPGRALITGKCADVGAIVIPQFHGLSARAPYFSNGSAATLDELVDFYRDLMGIRFSREERRDLVSYLSGL